MQLGRTNVFSDVTFFSSIAENVDDPVMPPTPPPEALNAPAPGDQATTPAATSQPSLTINIYGK